MGTNSPGEVQEAAPRTTALLRAEGPADCLREYLGKSIRVAGTASAKGRRWDRARPV